MSEPSKEVLDAITQGRETGYALGMRDAKTVTDEMVERALAAGNGRLVDTRRYWTPEDRSAVRDMLVAALSQE